MVTKTDGTIALPPADAERLAGIFGANAGSTATLISHLKTYIANMESMIKGMSEDGRQMQSMITELDTNTKDVMMRSAGSRAQRFDAAWEAEFKPAMTSMNQRIDEDFVPWMKKMDTALTDFKTTMAKMETALGDAQRELAGFARDMVAAGG
ncbi:MAG: hypothetical protein ACRDT4_24875 [Micromonosporaceae bacterium]